MINYPLMIKSFLPRSKLILVLGILTLIAGIVAPVMMIESGAQVEPWITQYVAVMLLAGVGLSLGYTLRQARIWSVALLVPHLLNQLVYVALALLFVIWSIYALIMQTNGLLAGFVVCCSLGAGACGLLLGSGVYRRVVFVLFMLAVASMYFEPIRSTAVTLLAMPLLNVVILLVLALVGITILHVFKQPLTDRELKIDTNLAIQSGDMIQFNKTRFSTFLNLNEMSVKQAFSSAFEHSRLQAWINDVFVVTGITLFAFVVLMVTNHQIGDVALPVSMMICMLAVISPMVARGAYSRIKDFLWLTGSHENKITLAFNIVLIGLRPAMRMAGMGLLINLLLAGFLQDEYLQCFSMTMLLLVPGIAAMVLSVGLVLDRYLSNTDNGVILLFSLVLLILLGGMGTGAVFLSSQFSFFAALSLAALFSVISLPLVGYLTALRLANQEVW